MYIYINIHDVRIICDIYICICVLFIGHISCVCILTKMVCECDWCKVCK